MKVPDGRGGGTCPCVGGGGTAQRGMGAGGGEEGERVGGRPPAIDDSLFRRGRAYAAVTGSGVGVGSGLALIPSCTSGPCGFLDSSSRRAAAAGLG